MMTGITIFMDLFGKDLFLNVTWKTVRTLAVSYKNPVRPSQPEIFDLKIKTDKLTIMINVCFKELILETCFASSLLISATTHIH